MKARLLKVIVQPVVVFDDGETLEEMACQPVTVSAKNWPGFSSVALGQADMEALAKQRGEKAA